MSEDLPRTYPLSEAAQLAGVTSRTIRRWLAEGYLPAVKVGGRWRISQETLDRLLRGDLGPYKRRTYTAGKPTGYTKEARARKRLDALNTEGAPND